MRVDRIGRVELFEATSVHDAHPVGDRHGFLLIVIAIEALSVQVRKHLL